MVPTIAGGAVKDPLRDRQQTRLWVHIQRSSGDIDDTVIAQLTEVHPASDMGGFSPKFAGVRTSFAAAGRAFVTSSPNAKNEEEGEDPHQIDEGREPE